MPSIANVLPKMRETTITDSDIIELPQMKTPTVVQDMYRTFTPLQSLHGAMRCPKTT